jgi:succinoglycan biosynthesis protein ExoM
MPSEPPPLPARQADLEVLVCTFRRDSLEGTLASVARQELPQGLRLALIVADNDDTPSARPLVAQAAARLPVPVTYLHAPSRNISLARNACLDAARAPWIAFIDDDETADRGWLAALLARADETGADAVFGPAIAEYDAGAPGWMRRQDHHSNRPVRRGGRVETGHTCNALLRWADTPWQGERFDLARGQSGGEDTEFFFRLRRLGARYEIAEGAVVREPVAADRLRPGWLLRRKYRMGVSHASAATGLGSRASLGASAAAKAVFCAAGALAGAGSAERRWRWALRGALHAGVVGGCLALPAPRVYGGATSDPQRE